MDKKYKTLTVRIQYGDNEKKDKTVKFDLFPSEQAIAEKLNIPLEDYIKAKFDLIVKEK
jgi:hypothetical protein